METIIKKIIISMIAIYSIELNTPFSRVSKQPPPLLYGPIISYREEKCNIILIKNLKTD